MAGQLFSILGLKKKYAFNVRDIDTFIIEARASNSFLTQEGVKPYFNLDSCRRVVRLKNDSIEKSYATGKELILELITSKDEKPDTIPVITYACYNMGFRDNNQVEYGVVQRLTRDSIYISSSFNTAMAARKGKQYIIYRYAISDIAELHLLKSNNFTSRKVKTEDCKIVFKEINRSLLRHLWRYSLNEHTGEIMFNSSCLADGHFFGFSEQDGRPTLAIGYEE